MDNPGHHHVHRQWRGVFAAVLVTVALTGCAGTVLGPEEDADSAARLAWETRLTALEALGDWTAAGRIALTVPDEAVNANVEWRQAGDAFRLDLSGPFGQGQVRLEGRPGAVNLELADGSIESASSAEQLVARRLGWVLPVSGLSHWLLGRPDPAAAVEALEYDSLGRPTSLRQSGWFIEYARFVDVDGAELPARLSLRREAARAKVIVTRWELNSL